MTAAARRFAPIGADGCAVFPALSPATHRPHALHSAERAWPETNCSVDLTIEIVAALGAPPEAALAFTPALDFEGDQFTFFKVPPEDLETLYGLQLFELAIYDVPEAHLAEQVRRGRMPLVELDSFFLPDTRGLTYRSEHGKTTVGVDRIDLAARRMHYFHNAGYFELAGEDFEGIFQTATRSAAQPFLPYCEFLKFPETPIDLAGLPEIARTLLARHSKRRPERNPIAAFTEVFAEQAATLYDRPAFFHKYAFATLRQLGANFLLLADHLGWLEGAGYGGFPVEREAAMHISDTVKAVQFQLARAIARRRAEVLPALLVPAINAWETLVDGLDRRV